MIDTTALFIFSPRSCIIYYYSVPDVTTNEWVPSPEKTGEFLWSFVAHSSERGACSRRDSEEPDETLDYADYRDLEHE